MTKDKYCYHGLLWLAQGENVNIYDAESGDLLVEDFALTERKDTIELPKPEFPYIVTSPWYRYENGVYTTISGRTFAKTNAGDGYVIALYAQSATGPMLLSMDQNCVKTNNPSYEHSFEYDGKTWWTGGNQYGFGGSYSNVPYYMDISSQGPYSSSSADNYRLPIIQKSTAALNIIYNKNVPIPQSL